MTDSTAAELLPETCYATLPMDGSLTLLKRDVEGYWPAEGYSMGLFQSWDEVADFLNEKRGVTKAQRAAMEAGSMWGFHIPAADPRRYDENGKLKA